MLSDRVYDSAARREQPLRLPAGVIRRVLVLGFLAMGLVLAWRTELATTRHYFEFFVILAGLVAGHLVGKVFTPLAASPLGSVLVHAKGLADLTVTAVLVRLYLRGTAAGLDPAIPPVLAATVTFYFGTRS